MVVQSPRARTRASHRLAFVLALGIVTLCSACADSIVSPAPVQHVAPRSTPARDDGPPNLECRSGWIEMDGHWVCPD